MWQLLSHSILAVHSGKMILEKKKPGSDMLNARLTDLPPVTSVPLNFQFFAEDSPRRLNTNTQYHTWGNQKVTTLKGRILEDECQLIDYSSEFESDEALTFLLLSIFLYDFLIEGGRNGIR